MEVSGVENLLDFVYSEQELTEVPSLREFNKLKRIMTVMINFYVRGTQSKKEQVEQITDELIKMQLDQKMIQDQLEVLKQFPSFHPKRREYEGDLNKELSSLLSQREEFLEKKKEFERLYQWSQGIVKTVQWLETNLEDYANQVLKMEPKLKINELDLTTELFVAYIRGLNEITFNLQESQDFFNASLDGRLRMFHQLEKCMVEAQLEAIRKYPEDSPRRQFIESELVKDLEYVSSNMQENPKVISHRTKDEINARRFFCSLEMAKKEIKSFFDRGTRKNQRRHRGIEEKTVGRKRVQKRI